MPSEKYSSYAPVWFGLFSDHGRQLRRLKDYEEMLIHFNAAIMYGYGNDCGKQGVCAFLQSVADVCEDNLEKSGRKSSSRSMVYNLGGPTRGGVYSSTYAFRSVVNLGDRIEVTDQLRKPDMWCVHDCSYFVGPYLFSFKVPDVAIMIVDRESERGGGLYFNSGLVVGEVKSDAEMDEAKWEADINQAVVQAMKALAYQDHSAAVVVSPHKAAFMSFDKQDGFIKSKQKVYSLGDGNRMFAVAYEEFFHNLVGYLWDRYYSCL